jgi:hypothetical protein
MKIYRIIVLLVTLAALLIASPVLAAPLHQEGSPPVVPDWLTALIFAGLTWLITQGIKSLSETIPWVTNLQGQATALVAALVGVIVFFGNGFLSMIPAEYHAGVIALSGFLGTLLSAYGISKTVKGFQPPVPVKK